MLQGREREGDAVAKNERTHGRLVCCWEWRQQAACRRGDRVEKFRGHGMKWYQRKDYC